jgi:3-phosphoshikimate 1-carboxyvinyltransferase
MELFKIKPSLNLSGEIRAPPSKSHTHRALIISLLSKEKIKLVDPLMAGDTYATINACESFGAKIKISKDELELSSPIELNTPRGVINTRNSGTTLRFMIPIAALVKGATTFSGSLSLKQRPIADLIEALTKLNIKSKYVDKKGFPPITIFGSNIFGKKTEISGSISSQFISGLLITLPYPPGDKVLVVKPPIKSKPYIKMTLDMLKGAKINIKYSKDFRKFEFGGNQKYQLEKYIVPGDFSSSAFILAAAGITNSEIIINNLDMDVIHPDKQIIYILRKMGLDIEIMPQYKKVKIKGGSLKGQKIYCGDNPDLIPILAVIAAFAEGRTILYGAEHVRFKESNRLLTIKTELKKLGVNIKENATGLTIVGGRSIRAKEPLKTYNDHRIFMALSIAALKSENPVLIEKTESYKDSYPRFIEDIKKIGVEVEEEI